jgi:type II secretory pathway component PulL
MCLALCAAWLRSIEERNMTQYALDLPDSLLNAAREAAMQDGTTVDQLLTVAIAEKLSALQTETLLAQRAKRADLTRYWEILRMVPDTPPLPGDELPSAPNPN